MLDRLTSIAAWPQRPLRLLGAVLLVLLLAQSMLASHAYMAGKTDFFDDTFIYLHISQNAVESRTYRFFLLSDRNALLASSPLRVAVLTAATAITTAIGEGGRSLESAKSSLWVSTVLSFVLFAPWWWRAKRAYVALGIVYFTLAAGVAGIMEFESGLLLLWAATSMRAIVTGTRIGWSLALLLCLGPLIRPDMALVALPMLAILAAERGLLAPVGPVLGRLAAAAGGLAAAWIGWCVALGVFPIPASYLTKSALPFMFEKSSFAAHLLERAAVSLTLNSGALQRWLMAVALGLMIAGLAGRIDAPTATGKRRVLRLFVPAVISAAMFSRMPANYWWYYDNAVMLLLGFALAWAAFAASSVASRVTCLAGVLVLGGLFLPRAGSEGTLPWSWNPGHSSRTPGYLAIASRALGDGRYDVPGLGPAIIMGLEVGIISYFSGPRAFVWDIAGLAQAPDHKRVRRSLLRYAYPARFLETGREEALRLRWEGRTNVTYAWVFANREELDAGRSRCAYVHEVSALCALCVIPDAPLVRGGDPPLASGTGG